MKFLPVGLALVVLIFSSSVYAQDPCPATLDFSKRYLASEKTVRLCDEFRDHVLLIVNTASYCGFTPQYQGLEALYEKYRDRGFSVLGFPSNDFFQEPKGEKKVQEFCRLDLQRQVPDVRKKSGRKKTRRTSVSRPR